ncbi:Uncharacterized protein At4g02000 [Linum perenne]
MQHRLVSAWRPGKGVTMEDLGGRLILFRFYHEKDLRWVLENGPWSWDKALPVMKELQTGDTPSSVPLTHADFWVQIHELPPKFCTERVGKVLGSFVGEVLNYDAKITHTHKTPYMRVRIRLDVTRPLKVEKKVRRPGGDWLEGKFRYERLPTFCYVCGRIGHVERHCEIWYRTPDTELLRKWDATLRAELRRPNATGGEQWLVPGKAVDMESDGSTRLALGQLSENVPIPVRAIPSNVQALINNLGVRAGGSLSQQQEDAEDDMEGVEMMDDRKRRRSSLSGKVHQVGASGVKLFGSDCHVGTRPACGAS